MTREEKDPSLLVAEDLTHADKIAKAVFGSQWSEKATFKIYDLLQQTDNEEELAEDFRKARAVAMGAFGVSEPTVEMVLGTFKRMFEEDDEDE